MKLSAEAQNVLDSSMRHNQTSDADRQEILSLVEMMPDSRVMFYRNVDSNPIGDLPRYSMHIRIQHMLTFVSFLALAFTGLPILFLDAVWADPFNSFLGGLGVTRIIHRVLAIIMIFAMFYHLATIIGGTLRSIVRQQFDIQRTAIPLLKDIRDFKEDLLYFAGKRSERPEMDKFMYKQKIHYYAAAFGNFVMIASGSSFLFPEVWASIIPGPYVAYFQELMRLSHPHEALLALLVIAFWHWYNVHLAPGRFPMQWTFLTGRITREHQIEEHFLEYLRNLVEEPEERAVIREMLQSEKMQHALNNSSGSSLNNPRQEPAV